MNKITESTFVPISLLITIIGATVYVSFAMAKLDNVLANDIKQDQKIEGQFSLLLDIRDRLIRLEEKRK
jgi:hypothetical protein